MTSVSGNGADLAVVEELFREHLATHRGLPDSARIRDLGAERELIRDYSGRVVFELLQNALDRCDRNILIVLKVDEGNGMLLMGNDGVPVSAHGRTDDGTATGSPTRGASDFHALLSLHSSTKSARSSIGNKGVGFRSVFASSTRVEVWSRCSDRSWWSLEMSHPSRMEPLVGVPWSDTLVASFYNPLQQSGFQDASLSSRFGLDSLEGVLHDMVTLVVLPEIPLGQLDPERDIQTSITELRNLTLGFLAEKYPGKEIRVEFVTEKDGTPVVPPKSRDIGFDDGWIVEAGDPVPMNDALRDKSGLELEEARVLVALSPELTPGLQQEAREDGGHAAGSTRYWSFLPTEQPAGFGVEVHADFYLNNSRRNVTFRFGDGEDPQSLNGRLLQSAAVAVVERLWRREAVLGREDFWALLQPSACRCEHLKKKVAELLLHEDELKRLVVASFTPERRWTLRRYRDFFKAINDWAEYRYHNEVKGIAWDKQYKLKERFWGYVRECKAPVLPIIAAGHDEALPVSVAIPLPPKLEVGGGGRGVNIFYRPATADKTEWFDLPDIVKRQGSYITSYRPEGMSESECGMVEFNRVELMGRLNPGNSAEEHREVLQVALRLGAEKAERGEMESVLDRCLARRTPGWRFLVEAESSKTSNLRRAARALSRLYVPVRNGEWQPAGKVTRPGAHVMELLLDQAVTWPWPIVDLEALDDVISGVAGVTPDAACTLLGITPGPQLVEVDKTVRLDGFGEPGPVRDAVAVSLTGTWNSFVGPMCGNELFAPLLRQLQQEQWLPAGSRRWCETAFGGRINTAGLAKDGAGDYISPLHLWLGRRVGGFHTRHLPTFVPSEGREIPSWIKQCGIVEIGSEAAAEKIVAALRRIRLHCKAEEVQELYTRLIKSLDEDPVPTDLPVLVRNLSCGRVDQIEWRASGDGVFFDNGDHTAYLSGFPSITVWAVRRHKAKIAAGLGIQTFGPKPHKEAVGPGNPEMEQALRQRIYLSLPDLIVASRIFSQQSEEFNEGSALERWGRLNLRHHDDVWLRLEQPGLGEGEIGLGVNGNIFIDPEDKGKCTLLFDLCHLEQLPEFLLECAGPLAETLCGNRAFLPVFNQVFTAWSHADRYGDDDIPATVQRLRRDLGVTEGELLEVKKAIEATMIPHEEKIGWTCGIRTALSRFGILRDGAGIQPGSSINQDTWREFFDVPCDERLVREELAKELATLARGERAFLVPCVDFASANRRTLFALAGAHLDELLAKYAVSTGLSCDLWPQLVQKKERIRNELAAPQFCIDIFNVASPSEEELLDVLRKMVGLDVEPEPCKEIERALSFIREGYLPLIEDNIVTAAPAVRPIVPHTGAAPLRPQDIENRFSSDRKKAIDGHHAELGVLKLALGRARDWLAEDPDGFLKGLLGNLAGKAGLPHHADLEEGDLHEKLKKVLHVSTWWGNAGYDLLMPERKADGSWSFYHVEVKRINSDRGTLQFHLSENERRKAMDASEKDPAWRLWLVFHPEGKVSDATASLPVPEKINEMVAELCRHGMFPESYLLQI